MIGKIVSVKDLLVYVKLNINVYEMDNMIGKNVVFANRYVGEIENMSDSLIEVSLVGEIVNKTFIPAIYQFHHLIVSVA